MRKPTGISRRIEQCIAHLQQNDYEGALVNLFPAVDATAKRRRPKINVGARVRAFLQDEEATISSIGCGSLIVKNYVDGVTVPEALYKFGRCPIAHEGELDPRLNFNESGELKISSDSWNFPVGYITGICVAAMASPENEKEYLKGSYKIDIFGKEFELNSIWGSREIIEKYIGEVFGDHAIFKECRA